MAIGERKRACDWAPEGWLSHTYLKMVNAQDETFIYDIHLTSNGKLGAFGYRKLPSDLFYVWVRLYISWNTILEDVGLVSFQSVHMGDYGRKMIRDEKDIIEAGGLEAWKEAYRWGKSPSQIRQQKRRKR